MPGLLPNAGRLYYGGYEFGACTETEGVTVTPRYDQAGRTVLYNRFVFRFATHISPTAAKPFGVETLAARRALSKPGAEFVYQGRGVADLRVNRPGGGGVRDVMWGPKPQELNFTVLGGGSAILTWSLEVCVPDCADAVYELSPMEFSFGVSYGRLADGRSTRTTSGFLAAPMTRRSAGDRTLPGSADDYRERVVGRLPVGFTRRFDPFRLDAAKTRLDFSYADEEMPANVPPPGVIRVKASHFISSGSAGLLQWTSTISAVYTLDPEADPLVAVKAFFAVLKDRLETLAKGQQLPSQAFAGGSEYLQQLNKDGPGVGKSIIPVFFRADEVSLYDAREVSLTFVYVFGGCSLYRALTAGGLWRPVPGSEPANRDATWRLWEASLRNSYLHPLGSARLRFDARDDQLVDLCREPEPSPGVAVLRGGFLPFRNARLERDTGELIGKLFPKPKPDDSWLWYKCEIQVEADSGGVPVRLLPGPPKPPPGSPPTATTELKSTKLLGPPEVLFGGGKDAVGPGPDALIPGLVKGFLTAGRLDAEEKPADLVRFHRRTSDVVYLTLVGGALRAGYEVVIPRLDSIDGVPCEPCNRADRGEGVRSWTETHCGQPVYAATWRLRYVLPRMPDRIPTPPNPLLGS